VSISEATRNILTGRDAWRCLLVQLSYCSLDGMAYLQTYMYVGCTAENLVTVQESACRNPHMQAYRTSLPSIAPRCRGKLRHRSYSLAAATAKKGHNPQMEPRISGAPEVIYTQNSHEHAAHIRELSHVMQVSVCQLSYNQFLLVLKSRESQVPLFSRSWLQ
jgi:hypothetical protein